MKIELYKILYECAQSSTSHAFPKIVNNKNWLVKAFWIICFLASSGYCVYNLNKSFVFYFQYESTTLIETHLLPSIEFPTVTFCNRNPFNPQKLENYTNIIRSINIIKTILSENLDSKSILHFMGFVEHESLQNVIRYKNFLQDVGYELNDLLIDCKFEDTECDKSDFVNIVIPKYGNCYQFNSGRLLNGSKIDLKQSRFPGISVGLKLLLFGGYENSEIDLFKPKGIQIFIHNSSILPYGEFDYINLPIGYETDIVIEQKLTKKLPKPFSRCIEDLSSKDAFNSRIYKRTVALFEMYSQKICLMVCYYEYIFDICKCYYPDFFSVEFSQMCTNQEGECLNKATINFTNSNFINECFNSCPEECVLVEFNHKISMSDFGNQFIYQLSKNISNITSSKNLSNFAEFKNNILAVNIYHDKISMTFAEEKPTKNFEQLVAEIGGFMGLCAGLSLLSIAEMFDILLKIIFLLHSKKKIGSDNIISK